MSKNYDNWERLVAAVLKREQFHELCRAPSIRTPSTRSISSSSCSDDELHPPNLQGLRELRRSFHSDEDSNTSLWIHLRSVLYVAAPSTSSPASSSFSDDDVRGLFKFLWAHRKRKRILSPQHWRRLFTPDGKLCNNEVKFLKKVRSGGVDHCIREEVWPFLLGVYNLASTKAERDITRAQKRKEYEKLRRQCHRLRKQNSKLFKLNESDETSRRGGGSPTDGIDSQGSEEFVSDREFLSIEDAFHYDEDEQRPTSSIMDRYAGSKRIVDSYVASDSDSSNSDSDSSDDPEDTDQDLPIREDSSPSKMEVQSHNREDRTTWQRIIRLDAIRANDEWMAYAPIQVAVSDARARRAAEAVGLKDYDHLSPCRIFHAARLVAILEAYALYDPEISYCHGMSDLLSPIITVMTEDHEAFWCFVGLMKKARHNFRLDEVGIRRQLNIVFEIVKYKDSYLYRHLEQLQAKDCFFVHRMLVVLFKRELTFSQTLCLWEVMWADQAAIRAGIGISARRRIKQQAPPADDSLLYAIAASLLQRRKKFIEKYNSMDEILRECNAMAGQLDVWKLLDDAHTVT